MKRIPLLCVLFVLIGCSTSRTVQHPYATVMAAVDRMYPAAKLDAEVYGKDPRKDGFQALGEPVSGVVRPKIEGSPRMVRRQEEKPGSEYRMDLIVYRGRPASINTHITVTAHDSTVSEIKIDSLDWNTIANPLLGLPARDLIYQQQRLDEVLLELEH